MKTDPRVLRLLELIVDEYRETMSVHEADKKEANDLIWALYKDRANDSTGAVTEKPE